MKQFTKPLVLLTILITLLLIASCSTDDGTETMTEEVTEESTEESEQESSEESMQETPSEETLSAEASNTIIDNVIILGGTKIVGLPPAPNNGIALSLPEVDSTGIVEEGFEIPLFSPDDITGVYLQFKAIDGAVSESYYDINLDDHFETPTPDAKSSKRDKGFGKKGKSFGEKSRNLMAKMDEGSLDIDLGSDIGPGEFCYIICAYDDAGNISAPVEVCITINAFGGNAALIGEWSLLRYEDTLNGVTEIETVGEEYCFETSCETEAYNIIIFNADGTYENKARYDQRDINGEYGAEFDEYIYRGKWSFPEAEGSDLVIVDYFISETDEDGAEEETYAVGDGEVYVTAAEEIELSSEELVFIFEYDDDGDGIIEETSRVIFEKQ